MIETENYRVANANEKYDFIIPMNLEHYRKTRERIFRVIEVYEKARVECHDMKLDMQPDIKRNLDLVDNKLDNMYRLTGLIPEFNGEDYRNLTTRQKRQLTAIVTGLAG